MRPTPNARPRRLFPAASLIPLAFLLLVVWAMMATDSLRARTSPLASIGVLAVFVLCFGALSLNLVGRVAAVVSCAVICLFLGAALRFYSPIDAGTYLWGKVDTLVLLGGIGLVTGVLAESGLFSRIAHRVVKGSGGDASRVAIRLCLSTYLLSTFVNNLATILVFVPLSLLIAEAMDIDARVLVVSLVVASNLGGASTMIGDFPNVLIATEVGLPFHEFLRHLAPVCLLELGLVLAYLAYVIPAGRTDPQKAELLVKRLAEEPFDSGRALRGLAILGLMVAGFLLSGTLHVSPAVAAGVGGVLAVLAGGAPRRALVKHLHLEDMLFFACLFVMVGAVVASGTFQGLASTLASISYQNRLAALVVIAWSAALVTTVLNAGPATALFVPILSSGAALGGATESVWWALSLGVCAGSSATLTGATAGPVAASLMEQRGQRLTFRDFAGIGVPLMFAFMVLNVAYLVLQSVGGTSN
jgi:Na+/H+ antiporter NhaD/arsenite permease-like protein